MWRYYYYYSMGECNQTAETIFCGNAGKSHVRIWVKWQRKAHDKS